MDLSFSKYKLISLIIILWFSFSLEAQNVNSEIANIKKWYAEIVNNSQNYSRRDLQNFLYIDGCNVTVSYSKDTVSNQIVLISTNGIADWMDYETDYYFKNGNLFFVFETGYSVTEWTTAEELGITSEQYHAMGGEAKYLEHYEHRIYFANESCIRYLEKKEVRKVDNDVSNMSNIENQTLDPSLIEYSAYKIEAQRFIDFIKSEE